MGGAGDLPIQTNCDQMDGVFFKNPCKGNGSNRGASGTLQWEASRAPVRLLQEGKGLCMLAPLAVPDRIDDVRLSRIDGVCPAAVIRNDGLNQPLLLTQGSPSRLSTERRRETSDALS